MVNQSIFRGGRFSDFGAQRPKHFDLSSINKIPESALGLKPKTKPRSHIHSIVAKHLMS